MKMREQHVVPLSRQANALFEDLHTLTGDGVFVFPSIRSANRPISEDTINAALRRLRPETLTAFDARVLPQRDEILGQTFALAWSNI
jgi:integrase